MSVSDPAGQLFPAGHRMSDTDPAEQYDPSGHGMADPDPAGQYDPAGHFVAKSFDLAPYWQNVPAGHGSFFSGSIQKWPAGNNL